MINFRKFFKGVNVKPKATTESNEAGDLEFLSSDNKLRLHDGTSNSPVVTEDHAATLENKSIDADANTITNIDNADIKVGADIARSKLAAGTVSVVPVNDASGVLTDSAVTATELGYVSGVTSAIQTQLDAKALASDLSDHLSDTADAHDASAISSVASGNLAATDVQAALDELQADVDTRLPSADLATHEADTSTHGVATVAGLSETQVLTNKDIDGGTASDTSRITLPKADKATLDALTRKEGTVVYASDLDKAYVDNGSALVEIGSGGAGGINLVTLDTSFDSTKLDNFNAEDSVGDWVAYADAAGSLPVDMTGGSPTVTLTRTTSVGEVLNGGASFLITKDAANRQGEGVSVLVNIPLAYRDKQLLVNVPFKVISGSIVEGDLKAVLYDVTNSQVITPFNNDLVGSYGTLFALSSVPANCTQVRLGFHFASTSTTALTLAFDDIQVVPSRESVGTISTDFTSFSMTIDATTTPPTRGTVVNEKSHWRRVGDSMQIMWQYEQSTAGSAGSGTYLFKIPNDLNIDLTKIAASTSDPIGSTVGHLALGTTGRYNGWVRVYSDEYLVLVTNQSTISDHVEVGSTWAGLGNTNQRLNFVATVPIVGWSSNVTLTSSSTIKMSNILANGTRVTSTPTQLGEYRAKYKAASSNNYQAWTDTAPTAAPSASSGMRLYSLSYSSAGSSGEPNAYEIFVGRNKHVKLNVFKSTGFTGSLSYEYSTNGATSALGVQHNYDPTTGIVYISAGTHGGGTTATTYLGWDQAAANNYTDGYFDIIVSENALAVGVQAPRSQVWLTGGNGFGSTNTEVRRFTNIVQNIGSDLLLTQSATLGDSITVLTDGVYSVSGADYNTGTAGSYAISINDTGNFRGTLAASNILSNGATNTATAASVFLPAGTVIRSNRADVNTNGVSAQDVRLIVTKVSN